MHFNKVNHPSPEIPSGKPKDNSNATNKTTLQIQNKKKRHLHQHL